MQIITLIVCLFSYSSNIFAIPETELKDSWQSKALNHFLSMDSGEFKNNEGQTLSFFYKLDPSNKKKLIVVPGRTEPAMKYAELLYDLKDQGYDLFIMDHQGQGSSSRIPQNSQKGHINRFRDYVTDLHTFVKEFVISKGERDASIFLIAHSMGGAISIKLMETWPGLIKKAALIAPMIEMNTAPYPESVARLFAKFLILTGKNQNFAPGHGPYQPENDIFENNNLTNSEARFYVSKFISVNYPKLVVAGPTNQWVNESIKVTKKLHLSHIQSPIILFQAGLDQVVKPRRQKIFCQNNDCELYTIPDAHHEILMEKDVIRNDVIMRIQDFFGL